MGPRETGATALAILLLIIASCVAVDTATEAPSETPTLGATASLSTSPTPEADDAVEAATQYVLENRDVMADDVELASTEREEWPDACLGLADEGEVCAEVITPGWRVTLGAAGKQYVLRTDQSGDTVRLESETGGPLPPVAAIAAQQALSERAGPSVEDIEIVSFERAEWPDACLGLADEGEVCAQVVTPGWRVSLSTPDADYVYRTNEDGTVVRPESDETA